MKHTYIYIIILISCLQFKAFAGPDDIEATCSANFMIIKDSMGPGHKPNTLIFDNTSKVKALQNDEVLKFEWDFGDGKKSFGVNAVHTYDKPDFYYICLKLRVVKRNDTNNIVCESNYCKNEVIVGNLKSYNLGGQVFAGKFPVKSGKADLYRIAPNHSFVLHRSMHFDTLGYFYFYKVIEGNFIIKITPDEPGFFSTYFGNAVLWKNAAHLKLENNKFDANVNLFHVSENNGPAKIQGNIIFDNTFPIDLKNITIILTDTNSNPIRFTHVDSRANYFFNNIKYGIYKIYADQIGWLNKGKTITVDADSPLSNFDIELSWNTVNSIDDNNSLSDIFISNLYPNPVTDRLNINLNKTKQASGYYILDIFNLQGLNVYKSQPAIINSATSLSFDVSILDKGIYFLRISDKSGALPIVKKFIKY